MPKKKSTQGDGEGDQQDRPLYVISVAAELVDMHPQTLRLYERKGLIEPSRSSGQTRLYSQRDIDHLREIRRLTQELGVNLAGVEEIIRLRRELDRLQGNMESRIDVLQGEISERILDYRKQGELAAPEDDNDADQAATDATIDAATDEEL